MFEINKADSKALVRQKLVQLLALSLFSVLVSLIVPEAAKAEGKDSGGGGGTVHDTFIKVGHRVLYYLKTDVAGRDLVKKHNLNLCRLKNTLREKLVYVSLSKAEKFVDFRGSLVDAYTFPWRIEINHSIWEKYFKEKRDIYNLVFKEMLRSEGTHFDNALVISDGISPFPKHLTIENADQTLKFNNEFKSWLAKSEDCLTQEDLKTINLSQNEYSHLLKNESPMCKRPDPEDAKMIPLENAVGFLMRKAKLNGCEIVQKPCSIDTKTKDLADGTRVIYRVMKRDGYEIYEAPHTIVNANGNRNEMFRVYYDRIINAAYKQLVDAKVCENTVSMQVASSDWRITSFDNGLFSSDMIFKDIREVGTVVQGTKYLIGTGSKLKVVDPKPVKIATSIYYVRVQVLENTIDSVNGLLVTFKDQREPHKLGIPSFARANEGFVGWAPLHATKFYPTFDKVLGVLTAPVIE